MQTSCRHASRPSWGARNPDRHQAHSAPQKSPCTRHPGEGQWHLSWSGDSCDRVPSPRHASVCLLPLASTRAPGPPELVERPQPQPLLPQRGHGAPHLASLQGRTQTHGGQLPGWWPLCCHLPMRPGSLSRMGHLPVPSGQPELPGLVSGLTASTAVGRRCLVWKACRPRLEGLTDRIWAITRIPLCSPGFV